MYVLGVCVCAKDELKYVYGVGVTAYTSKRQSSNFDFDSQMNVEMHDSPIDDGPHD